jgi:signal transduction histidine kinase
MSVQLKNNYSTQYLSEEEPRNSAVQIRAILNNINQSLILLDKDLTLKWSNKKADTFWVDTWGLELAHGSSIDIFMGQLHFVNIETTLAKAFIGKQFNIEKKIINVINQYIWLDITFIPNIEETGINSVLISIQDITERERSIYYIEQHDKILETMNYAAEQFISSQNAELVLTDVFARIGKALDVQRIYYVESETNNEQIPFMRLKAEWVSSKEYNLTSHYILYNNLYSASGLDRWYLLLSEGKIISSTILQLPSPEKVLFSGACTKSLIIMPVHIDNSMRGFLGFEDCIEERRWSLLETDALKMAVRLLSAEIKRIESKKELSEAKELASRSDTLKSHFLAQMSHEIRTPLNVILNFASLLKDEFNESKRDDLKTYFSMIENGSKRIIRTIEMMLNMSDLQSNSYEFMPVELDLVNNIFEPLLAEYKSVARDKNINLILNKNINNAYIFADQYSVNQIFFNILDNAIKYTSKGTIAISISEEENKTIKVEVEDTGIGISKAYLKELFTPFSQEETGYTRRFEGLGLGLSLVKKFANLNNASISVKSNKNVGTKFTILFTKREYENK